MWDGIRNRLKTVTDRRYRELFRQRMVSDLDKRNAKADAMAAKLPRFEASGKMTKQVATLQSDGFVMLPGVLKPSWVGELVDYFSREECFDPYRSKLGKFRAPGGAPKESHVAFFSNETVALAPHAFEIANHPDVLETVAGFLGAKPTITYMSSWWSLPAADGTAEHAEKFHRDVDDWRFVKLFCYLTDVDDMSGPHMFVRGSHRVNKLTKLRRFSEEEVESTFGSDKLVKFTGPAGTAFLETTAGVHRGIPVKTKHRLIFQVLYSLRPTIYGPKKPVVEAGEGTIPRGLDPFINRIYLKKNGQPASPS